MRIVIWFDHIALSMNKDVHESVAQALYDSIECAGQIRSVDLWADDATSLVAHKIKYDNAHNPEFETLKAGEPGEMDEAAKLRAVLLKIDTKIATTMTHGADCGAVESDNLSPCDCSNFNMARSINQMIADAVVRP